jgi:hypothetical protein
VEDGVGKSWVAGVIIIPKGRSISGSVEELLGTLMEGVVLFLDIGLRLWRIYKIGVKVDFFRICGKIGGKL